MDSTHRSRDDEIPHSFRKKKEQPFTKNEGTDHSTRREREAKWLSGLINPSFVEGCEFDAFFTTHSSWHSALRHLSTLGASATVRVHH